MKKPENPSPAQGPTDSSMRRQVVDDEMFMDGMGWWRRRNILL
jgi:hypothetical protein